MFAGKSRTILRKMRRGKENDRKKKRLWDVGFGSVFLANNLLEICVICCHRIIIHICYRYI